MTYIILTKPSQIIKDPLNQVITTLTDDHGHSHYHNDGFWFVYFDTMIPLFHVIPSSEETVDNLLKDIILGDMECKPNDNWFSCEYEYNFSGLYNCNMHTFVISSMTKIN